MIKKYKNRIIIAVAVAAVLAGAWFFGGNYVKTGSEAAQASSNGSGNMLSGPEANAGIPDAGSTADVSGDGESHGSSGFPGSASNAVDGAPGSSGGAGGDRDGTRQEDSDQGTANRDPANQDPAAPGLTDSGAADTGAAGQNSATQNTAAPGMSSDSQGMTQNEAAPPNGAQPSGGSAYPDNQSGGASDGASHSPGTDQQPAATGSSPASANEGHPSPGESQDTVAGDGSFTVTLSVKCDTLLSNLNILNTEKRELVPNDGTILAATSVTAYEGESVFNVFQREMKKTRIHMTFRNTPIYNSAYIEAVNNIYEFDAGELSGWMYSVNGWYPNYGSSRYLLSPGDVIEWNFTCDLGRDLGQSVTGGWQLDD